MPSGETEPLTWAVAPAICRTTMMASFRSLRVARLLAVLAMFLMAGLGQHVHASEETNRSVAAIMGDVGCPGDDGGKSLPSDAHCAACHLVRATIPELVDLSKPAWLRIHLVRPGEDLQRDLTVPDGPARPPRRTRAV